MAAAASDPMPPPEPAAPDLGSVWMPLKAGLLAIPALLLLAPIGIGLHLAGLISTHIAVAVVVAASILTPSVPVFWRQFRLIRSLREWPLSSRDWAKRDLKAQRRRHGLKSSVVVLPLMLLSLLSSSAGSNYHGMASWFFTPSLALMAFAEAWDTLECVRVGRKSLSDFERSSELDAVACAAASVFLAGAAFLLIDHYWRSVSVPLYFVCLLCVAIAVKRARIMVIDRRAERAA